ncbi:putative nucleotide-diphospho-sugar transferase [Salipiger sp. H15]|uniref:Nucleotide-diphospho-sugar transferase n=1 Tax=Alloyangia sp. H15 TaxID=3029062 RepID=A0AAU8AP38_9RHOB
MAASDLDIITCADSGFFEVVQVFEDNVLRIQGRYPVIYDLGMTEAQRAQLRSELVRIDTDASYKALDPKGFIRTTHKPGAIRHAIARTGRACLYLDADMLLTEPLTPADFLGADLAVTPRHPNEIAREQLADNGTINAGLLYFAATEPAQKMLDTWARLCAGSEMSDQRAMSQLLEAWEMVPAPGLETVDGLSLARLDARVYNDTARRTGKVLHYKNLGRKTRKRAEWRRMARLIALAPWAVQWLMRRRRAGWPVPEVPKAPAPRPLSRP